MGRSYSVIALAALALLAAAPAKEEVMQLSSNAFADNGSIPGKHTCEGADVSPALAWAGVPGGAKSLALIVDDPDAPDPAAPKMTWVHWVLYNLPPDARGLAEGIKPAQLPPGTRQGKNDWGRTGYGGPCPPVGRHRYFHKLYALDLVLPDLREPTKAQLEQAMNGHVLAQGAAGRDLPERPQKRIIFTTENTEKEHREQFLIFLCVSLRALR